METRHDSGRSLERNTLVRPTGTIMPRDKHLAPIAALIQRKKSRHDEAAKIYGDEASACALLWVRDPERTAAGDRWPWTGEDVLATEAAGWLVERSA